MSFIVKRNDKVGRYLVASHDLKAGEEIFTELPFVVGPKSGTKPLCLGCYCPVDCSTVCTECGWPVCGVSCEERSLHRQGECGVFSAAKVRYQPETGEQLTNGSPQYECITPLRMLLNKERDPDRWETEIVCMLSHTEERKPQLDWAMEQINVVDFLRNKCKLAERFSEDIIHWVIGVLEVNAFEVKTEYNGWFIRGLYPQTGIMSHNCVANMTHSISPTDNFRSKVRTTIDIPEGGELFVSYTSSIQPTIFRRENLKYSKYFDCDCSRCSDPTELGTHLSTLKCTKCDNGLITSSDPLDQEAIWKCSHCEFTIRADTVKKIFTMIQTEIEEMEVVEDYGNRIQQGEKLLKKFKSVLHPHHVYLTSIRHTLVQLYGRARGYTFDDLPDILLERKVELCRKILEVVDVVKPGMNRFRGMALYELHVPLMLFNRSRFEYGEFGKEEFKTKMQEVAKILEEAVDILCLEDPASPEGGVGLAGKESLEQLRLSIDKL